MSYTIRLEREPCPTCKREWSVSQELPDPTYNLTPIFDFALSGDEEMPNPKLPEIGVVLLGAETDRPRGLRLLNGKRAGDTVPMLEAALARMSLPANQEKLRSLEPANGWGRLSGAIDAVVDLLEAARGNPDHVWEVC